MVNSHYIAILLLFIISLLFAIIPLISNLLISYFINKNNSNKKIANLSKNSQLAPYECGCIPNSDARFNFPIKFTLIGILFVIFDLELIFLFPCAIVWTKLSTFAKLTMAIFLLILAIGFVYEWKKGVLKWE